MTSIQFDKSLMESSRLHWFCQILCEKFYHINALPKNLFAVGPVFTGSTIQARIAWRNVVDVWWSHRENLDTRWGKYSNSLWVGVAVLKILFYTLYMSISHLYINYQAKTSIHAGCKLQVLDSAPFCWPTAIIQWLTATCEGFQASTINNQVCELWVMGHPFHAFQARAWLILEHSWGQGANNTTPRGWMRCLLSSHMTNRTPQAKLTSSTFTTRAFHLILPEYSIIKL